jgi:hypothetical protein
MAVERLFLLSGAARREAILSDWFKARPGILGALARQWFDVARRCGPDVRWLLHDGCPVACLQDAAFVYVNVYRLHVNVGFYQRACCRAAAKPCVMSKCSRAHRSTSPP